MLNKTRGAETLTDAEWAEAIAEASRIGAEHGANAAAWWEQDVIGGRVPRGADETAQRVLTGLEDGDPEILDSLPAPDLSGQWADSYDSSDLEADCDVSDPFGELADAYSEAFSEACYAAIEKACRELLAD